MWRLSISNAPSVTVPILMYHQVSGREQDLALQPGLTVKTDTFRRQLLVLRALGYQAIRPEDIFLASWGKRHKPKRAAVFTFDDGYAGVYENAFPLLKQFGYAATLFLIAEDYGKSGDSEFKRAFPVLTAGQIREMIAFGFQVGSHTVSHPRLPELLQSDAQAEIQDSKTILEDTFGVPVTSFSYPYGKYDPRVMELVKSAGYSNAVSTRFGRTHQQQDSLALKRISVGAAQTFPHFVYRLLWAKEANE